MTKQTHLLAKAALSCVLFTAPSYAEETVQFSAGVDYSSGDYGASEDTEILYIPFTAKYSPAGPFSLSITVPYLRIDGPGVIVGGGDGGVIRRHGSFAPPPPVMLSDRVESGLGDIVARAALTHDLDAADARLYLSGSVKIPTADEDDGLGTGEFDYSVYGEATKYFGRFSVYAGAGYRFLGDSQALPLDNVFYFSAGGIYELSRSVSAGVGYRYQESATGATSGPSEITGSLYFDMTENWRAETYGLVGLSNGSPDFGAGFRLRLSI